MLTDRQPRSFLDAQVLSRLAGIPLFARRPMQGNVSGRHASPHRGSSVEFAEYRKYVPGDDLRRLDWRAYGRSDRFYVKEFEADTDVARQAGKQRRVERGARLAQGIVAGDHGETFADDCREW